MASGDKLNRFKSKKVDGIEEQEVLQAVLIADNFSDAFLPLSYEKPTILFPLVNKPLLDYSLEALAKCGVQETFVFCCSHAQQIRDYVKLNWGSKDASMTVSVLSSESFMSIGDVIRELDSQAVIRSDFILMCGGTITTLNLINILEEHKKCRKNDKGCSMTLIYRRALPKHRTRCLEDDVVIATESNTNKVRFFQKVKKKRTSHIPLEVFQENSKVTVHYDLQSCQMCICSPSIPPLYSDNFDYQTLDDLIRGLIINEEILASSMYLHLAKNGYAANVSNLYMYDAVSRDIIQRWSYPVVPDLFNSNGKVWLHRHNIYKENGINLDRNCLIWKNSVIGKGTRIGENSNIIESIIGRNCVIGANVIIKGCFIWNNVTIGDNCVLDTCLLADKVILKDRIKISPGCVISYNVILDNFVELPSLTKLQSEIHEEKDEFGDFNKKKSDSSVASACNPKYVGASGRGYLFEVTNEDSDSEDDVKDIWGLSRNGFEDDEDDDDESATDESSTHQPHDLDEIEEDEGEPEEEDTLLFYNEVLDSLQRGIEEQIKSENLILEINSSKYAYNVTMKEVNFLVTKAILAIPLQDKEHSSTEYFKTLKPILMTFIPLMTNYIKNASSQMDCLQSIEDFISDHDNLASIVVKIVHFYYEEEILSENVILKWAERPSVLNGKLKKYVLPFIKWLKEADEESSGDD